MPEYDFGLRLYRALDWPINYEPNRREANIIRHYTIATTRGFFTDNTAIERIVGDIKGWNWHPTRCYGNPIKGE